MRKTLGGLYTVLGLYYCVLGVLKLMRLPGVTREWIERSGDPDFQYDYGLFMMLSGVGATLIAVLGWRTVVKGVATAAGRQESWLGPAIAALPLHWFWFLYRVIDGGMLDPHVRAVAQRNTAIQFGTVCLGYLLLWLSNRNRNGPADIAPPDRCGIRSGPSTRVSVRRQLSVRRLRTWITAG
jgi:hypothetical protein